MLCLAVAARRHTKAVAETKVDNNKQLADGLEQPNPLSCDVPLAHQRQRRHPQHKKIANIVLIESPHWSSCWRVVEEAADWSGAPRFTALLCHGRQRGSRCTFCCAAVQLQHLHL